MEGVQLRRTPVETRFLWKASDGGWLAGSYVWNKEGTDAVLGRDDGVAGAMGIAPGRQHNIPSRGDCAACHGEARRPLGFNPLQLSDDRDPNAIHGEPLTPGMVTLRTLLDEGLLTARIRALRRTPPRIAAARSPDPRRARLPVGQLRRLPQRRRRRSRRSCPRSLMPTSMAGDESCGS